MPQEALATTSVLDSPHTPLSHTQGRGARYDPTQAPSGAESFSHEDSAYNNNTRSRRGNHATRGDRHPPRNKQQQQQLQQPTKPALGSEAPITLMKRQTNQEPPSETSPSSPLPLLSKTLPISSSNDTAGSSDPLASSSKSGGILQISAEDREATSQIQSPTSAPRPGAKTVASRNHTDTYPHHHKQQRQQQQQHDRPRDDVPAGRVNGFPKTRGDSSARAGFGPGSAPRGPRSQVRGSPELFDRGTERARDGHHSQHQLFDPRKHNALTFSRGVATSTGSASASDARTLSNAGSTAPTTAPSVASNESRDRQRRRGVANSDVSASSKHSDRRSRQGDDRSSAAASHQSAEANGYVTQLKKAYHELQKLEAELKEEHQAAPERDNAASSRLTVGAAPITGRTPNGDVDHKFWLRLAARHKRLSDLHNVFLDIALRPGLPSSHRSLPQDYNLPIRLWQVAFHLFLERLRQALPYPTGKPSDGHVVESEIVVQNEIMDHFIDFIYYGYRFYSTLLEVEALSCFRSFWLENLGDLARYRMAVAGLDASFDSALEQVHISASRSRDQASSPSPLQVQTQIDHGDDDEVGDDGNEAASPTGVQQAEVASSGSAALSDWEVEPRQRWSTTAKDWYAKGLAETPGRGRLHHHLAFLNLEDSLRALHHFCKALTTAQPYTASRESILNLFSPEQQQRRLQSDATLVDLFVHMHGMLFTRVELDDFEAVCTRFLRKLKTVLDEKGWETGVGSPVLMMMGTVNIASAMQYGSDNIVFQGLPSELSTVAAKPTVEGAESSGASDQGHGLPAAEPQGNLLPIAQQNALHLMMATLDLLLPKITVGADSCTSPNPYVTLVMTFLFRLTRASTASSSASMPPPLRTLERYIPWSSLARLPTLNTTLRRLRNVHKISAPQPLPEDWCLRGLSWTGRKLFEREFFKHRDEAIEHSRSAVNPPWASTDFVTSEVDVFNATKAEEGMHGDGFGSDLAGPRWKRLNVTLNALLDAVSGFECVGNAGEDPAATIKLIEVKAPLSERLEDCAAEEEARKAEVSQALRYVGNRSDTALQDEDSNAAENLSDEEDCDDDSLELRDLKARCRELRLLLQQQPSGDAPSSSTVPPKGKRRGDHVDTSLKAVQGYTTLVLDTNVILTAGTAFLHQLVESRDWTVVLPLAVVTELDGIQRKPPPLGEHAALALSFLEKSLKTHQTWLKVQTSKGNYLSDLKFRHEDLNLDVLKWGEEVDVAGNTNDGSAAQDEGSAQPVKSARARTLDEVIFRCFLWQRDHWTDRRNLVLSRAGGNNTPSSPSIITADTPKVIMVTLDRGLRMRVRAKGGPAAGQKELAHILAITSKAAKS